MLKKAKLVAHRAGRSHKLNTAKLHGELCRVLPSSDIDMWKKFIKRSAALGNFSRGNKIQVYPMDFTDFFVVCENLGVFISGIES